MQSFSQRNNMNTKQKDIIKRILKSIFGLFIFSIGDYLTIVANIGLTPWDSLTMGIANSFNISFGTISVASSIIIIIIDLLMNEKIGFGTVLDAIFVGTFVDFFIADFHIPYARNTFVGIIYLTIGLLIMAIGQVFYMSSGLSCGPRDTLLIAVGKRLPKIQIGHVDILMKVVLIGISLIIKGPIGIGTLYAMVMMGFAMQMVYKIFNFEPRDVKHESVIETINSFVKHN